MVGKNEGNDKKLDEITKLKNKRKDLEKQTQKMEKEMQKLNEKLGKNAQKPKEIDSAIDILKQEHEKSKKIYQIYRSEKFFEKISKIFAAAKKTHEKNIFLKMKDNFLREMEKISNVNLFSI